MKEVKVEYVPFPSEQYYQRECEKKQIVLHHTVSGKGISGDVQWWLSTTSRIATAFIIDRTGAIHQNFSSKYWAHHLGVKMKVFKALNIDPGGANVRLNMESIGIELDSWGGLKDPNKVDDFTMYVDGFRGFTYFETYTKEQLTSLSNLLKFLCDKYSIPKDYNSTMWDVSKEALEGKSGIWGHTSFRSDKSDVHPQPTLIDTLQGLNEE